MKARLLLFVLVFCFLQSSGQDCSCRGLLDSLIVKTEANYAGYIHKVKTKDSSEYGKLKKQLRALSVNVSYLDCYDVMDSYIRFFQDDHLFIVEYPRANARQTDSLRQLHLRYTGGQKKNSQPGSIEGLWQQAGQQLEIVPVTQNTFYGVVKTTSIPGWEPGMVRMEITRTGDNEYNIRHYNDDFTWTRYKRIRLYKRLLLGYGMQKFVKLDPADPESQYIHTANPEQPYFRIIDKDNILVTVPSALIDRKILDSILISNKDVILSAKNFILDLRGNRGGNFMWSGINMIANTREYAAVTAAGVDDFQMLASKDNAAYFNAFKNYVGNDSLGIRFYTDLNKRIRENIGNIIGFSFYNSGSDTARRQVFANPQRVAVIVDKGVASAAEAVIQSLRANSTKLVLYGANTSGMIDYVNVNSVWFGGKCNSRYVFGYPTFFSPEILKNPVNPTGIKPNVYIPVSNRDWIQWVLDDLKK